MKNLVIGVLLLVLVGLPISVLASEGDNHGRSVDEVVADIMAGQEADSVDKIDCTEIRDDRLDELGDAVMQDMVGDDERHEVMDRMMGGEGSDSLRAMHEHMGQRYLGCAGDESGSLGMGSMGMMGGSGMMGGPDSKMGLWGSGAGGMMGGGSSMMGNIFGLGNAMGLGGGMLVFWVLVIVVIGLLVVWFNRGQNAAGLSNKALGILKERYAKGEIDEQEFETKKKGLI